MSHATGSGPETIDFLRHDITHPCTHNLPIATPGDLSTETMRLATLQGLSTIQRIHRKANFKIRELTGQPKVFLFSHNAKSRKTLLQTFQVNLLSRFVGRRDNVKILAWRTSFLHL